MTTRTRPTPERSQRDELERLQGELRELRRQRDTLPHEHAELKARVDTLEEEVRALRHTLEQERAEWERPLASLPDQLVLPFGAMPSRRTFYSRTHFALRGMVPVLGVVAYLASSRMDSPASIAGLLLLLPACFGLLLVLQGDEDDGEAPAWAFEEGGFSQVRGPWEGHRVRYAEVEKVEVDQGWLQRLHRFGTVRVTFRPSVPTPLGEALRNPDRRVDLKRVDDPERLATWLRDKARAARGKAGPHAP